MFCHTTSIIVRCYNTHTIDSSSSSSGFGTYNMHQGVSMSYRCTPMFYFCFSTVVGQKLALRVGKQIDRCSSQIKKLVKVTNATAAAAGSMPFTMLLHTRIIDKEAFDPTSAMYASLQSEPTVEVSKALLKSVTLLITAVTILQRTLQFTVNQCSSYKFGAGEIGLLSPPSPPLPCRRIPSLAMVDAASLGAGVWGFPGIVLISALLMWCKEVYDSVRNVP